MTRQRLSFRAGVGGVRLPVRGRRCSNQTEATRGDGLCNVPSQQCLLPIEFVACDWNIGMGVDFTVVQLTGANGEVGPTSTLPPCSSDAVCEDGYPCTVESCVADVGCISRLGAGFRVPSRRR